MTAKQIREHGCAIPTPSILRRPVDPATSNAPDADSRGMGLPEVRGLVHFASSGENIKVSGPRLHHLAPLGEILGAVVGSAHAVSFRMRKLALNRVGFPPNARSSHRVHSPCAVALR